MKTYTCFILSFIISLGALAHPIVPTSPKIDPPNWWIGMAQDTLQIALWGKDIANAKATIDYPNVKIIETISLDSPNYLFLYLNISDDAKPGIVPITLSSGPKKTIINYELKKRNRRPEDYVGFDSSDVLYLIMPDRFADGDPNNNDSNALATTIKSDRKDPNGRHGGDLKGIRDHLGYIDNLGVTAIWVNPVLTNDMPQSSSYHGYATTDYYSIDPRLGTNQEWNDLISEAHNRGIKVVMDMIFNHVGSNHHWFTDRPSHDWFNYPDGFVQTNYRLSTLHDPYVSDYDRRRTVDGWFVKDMPDLNQNNPHLMKYLVQNSIWWIESSKIDGIRMDTHPYASLTPMSKWISSVMAEYPNYNIVGECWYGNEGGEAFWQKGSYVNKVTETNLPTVMDFVLSIKAREAFSSQTDRLSGLNAIYDHLSLDYLFPNPQNILTFLDNHDTDRFLLKEPNDLGWWKQAITFLLTSRGIPQIYYGTELLMHGSKEGSDGYVRRDMPGGFPGDTINEFTSSGRRAIQNEAYNYLRKLLNWRKGNNIIAYGSLKHFMPENGIYVYQRKLGDKQVIVMMNGNDRNITTTMERTLEVLPIGSKWKDLLTDNEITITEKMTFAPRKVFILQN